MIRKCLRYKNSVIKIVLKLFAEKKKGFLPFLSNPTYEGNWENWEFNYMLTDTNDSGKNEERVRQYLFEILEKVYFT